jgi:hypothetical protein
VRATTNTLKDTYMTMFQRATALAVAVTASLLFSPVVEAGQNAKRGPGDPTEAVFEQGEIDLSESWGDATACIELGDHTECFRTDAEMLAAHPEIADGGVQAFGAASTSSGGDVSALASCSSSLRLYRLNGFGGGSLVLTTRAVVFNLSTFGFDNDTSSYRVGACASTFWAGANGSGAIYGGPTGANASATAMLPGWDNSISSVYIS